MARPFRGLCKIFWSAIGGADAGNGQRNRDSSSLFFRFSVIIVLLILLVHILSLFHTARADQIAFLADWARTDNLGIGERIVQLASFNRVRDFIPGDKLLFRPIFYFVLGMERAAFGYQFECWQLIGILLHIAVSLMLLRLLLRIQPSILALLVTAHFAVLYAGMEMVVWHHIHGYLVFVLVALITLYQISFYEDRPASRSWRIWVIFVLLLVAAFTMELGVVLPVLLALYLLSKNLGQLWSRKIASPLSGVPAIPFYWTPKWHLVLIFLPFFVYVLTSIGDLLYRESTLFSTVTSSIPNSTESLRHSLNGLLQFSKKAFLPLQFWLIAGLAPLNLPLRAGGSIELYPQLIPIEAKWGSEQVIGIAIGISIGLLCLFILTKTISKRFILAVGPFAILMGVILLVFSAMVTTRRDDLAFALSNKIYYSYLFWAFFIILIYSLLDFKTIRQKVSAYHRYAVVCLVVITIIINAALVARMNLQMEVWGRDQRGLVAQIERLTVEHGKEPGFSFYVAPDYPGNVAIEWLWNKKHLEKHDWTLVEALYPQYATDLAVQRNTS